MRIALAFCFGFGSFCAALGAACGPSQPAVTLSVIRAPSAAPLDRYERLRLIVRPCGSTQLSFAGDIDFKVPAGGAQRPTTDLTLDVRPDEPFSIWLQAWSGCTDACRPERETRGGSCTCFDELTPPKQQLIAEGCTDWTTVPAGEATTLPVRLSAHDPAAPLCPTRAACEAP